MSMSEAEADRLLAKLAEPPPPSRDYAHELELLQQAFDRIKQHIDAASDAHFAKLEELCQALEAKHKEHQAGHPEIAIPLPIVPSNPKAS